MEEKEFDLFHQGEKIIKPEPKVFTEPTQEGESDDFIHYVTSDSRSKFDLSTHEGIVASLRHQLDNQIKKEEPEKVEEIKVEKPYYTKQNQKHGFWGRIFG